MKLDEIDIQKLIDSGEGGVYACPSEIKPIPEVKEILPGLLASHPEKIGSLYNYLKSKRK